MKDVVIIGIICLCWLGTAAYIGQIAFREGKEYKNKRDATEKINIETNINTLYIEIDKPYKTAEPFLPNTHLYRMENVKENWFILPRIEVKKDSIYKEIKIEIKKTAYSRKEKNAEIKATEAELNYTLTDSMLIIKPEIYNVVNKWNRELFKIIIYCPIDKNVEIHDPIKKWIEMDKNPEKRKKNEYAFNYQFDEFD